MAWTWSKRDMAGATSVFSRRIDSWSIRNRFALAFNFRIFLSSGEAA
jgi:hypothetical protein